MIERVQILTDTSPPCLKNIATKARRKAVRMVETEGIGGEDYREEDKKRGTASRELYGTLL